MVRNTLMDWSLTFPLVDRWLLLPADSGAMRVVMESIRNGTIVPSGCQV
jgi:hypothetical protein